MKRWKMLVAVAGMMIGLYGCGASAPATEPADVAEKETEAVVEKTEKEETATEEPAKDAETELTVQPEEPELEVHVYDALLQQMYEAVAARSERLLDIDGMTGVHEVTRGMSAREALKNIGYHIEDLNGDRIPELVIGYIADANATETYGSSIYTVYTCDGETPKSLLDAFSRDRYDWMGGARFLNSGSGGAMYEINAIYELKPQSTELACEDFYFTHEKDGNYEDIRVYYNTTGEWDVAASQEQEMSVDEFWGFTEQRSKQVQQIELTPFLKYENVKAWDMLDILPEQTASNYMCAVAYLGNRDVDENGVIQELERDGMTEKYPFLSEIPAEHMVLTEGTEWYAIIPTVENASIAVRETVLNEEKGTLEEGAQYLQVIDSQPILIRANVSDIMPELLVRVERENGESITYGPCLSMRDGSLQTYDGVFDFTPYELLPSYAFCMHMNPSTPAYEYYQIQAYSAATLEVAQENVVPVLLVPLKESLEIKLELVEWNEDGEPVVTEVLEQRTLGTEQVVLIRTPMYDEDAKVRVTATYNENGVEKTAEWYAYGAYDMEYVCAY
ncbi:MAG: hypothetical protein J6B28_08540 [Eubacterium sp.]|nr:hypothetical protein [Eubacterium sp.]